jgi:hypothetical protein
MSVFVLALFVLAACSGGSGAETEMEVGLPNAAAADYVRRAAAWWKRAILTTARTLMTRYNWQAPFLLLWPE